MEEDTNKTPIFDHIDSALHQMSIHTVEKSDYIKDKARLKQNKDQFIISQAKFEKEREEVAARHKKKKIELENFETQLEEEERVFQVEKEKLDKEIALYERTQNAPIVDEELVNEKIIKLNVGGETFWTSHNSLTLSPHSRNSFLAAIFSGRYKSPIRDKEGCYFLDRNPKVFKHIMTFLRTGYVPSQTALPRDGVEWKLISLEVDYWGLSSWKEALLAQDLMEQLQMKGLTCSVTDVLEQITQLEDGIQMIRMLGTVHETIQKTNFSGKIIPQIDDMFLAIADSYLEQKSPTISINNFQTILREMDVRKLDPMSVQVLQAMRSALHHDPRWSEALQDIIATIFLTTGANGIISEGGTKFTKTAPTGWNCGIIGRDEIPERGISEWTVELGISCNNLMVGVSSGFGFNPLGANYSNQRGWYFYCYNGSLYSKVGSGLTWVGGPGASWAAGTKIRVVMDMEKKTLSFVVNGVDKGVAFRDVTLAGGMGKLYPALDAYENGCKFQLL